MGVKGHKAHSGRQGTMPVPVPAPNLKPAGVFRCNSERAGTGKLVRDASREILGFPL